MCFAPVRLCRRNQLRLGACRGPAAVTYDPLAHLQTVTRAGCERVAARMRREELAESCAPVVPATRVVPGRPVGSVAWRSPSHASFCRGRSSVCRRAEARLAGLPSPSWSAAVTRPWHRRSPRRMALRPRCFSEAPRAYPVGYDVHAHAAPAPGVAFTARIADQADCASSAAWRSRVAGDGVMPRASKSVPRQRS